MGSVTQLQGDTGGDKYRALNTICAPSLPRKACCQRRSYGLPAARMEAVLSLQLPCLLAEMWLAPAPAPSPQVPEAQARLEVPQTTPKAPEREWPGSSGGGQGGGG